MSNTIHSKNKVVYLTMRHEGEDGFNEFATAFTAKDARRNLREALKTGHYKSSGGTKAFNQTMKKSKWKQYNLENMEEERQWEKHFHNCDKRI